MSTAEPAWHKSSYSRADSNCVEIAEGTTTAIRDTQNRQAGHLSFPASEWKAFLTEVRAENL
ncbi:uncharacterized protein DUF397 [Haloactinospora alba]|uniref:Uncharacterized protein DUF397 n=1 Tax=Haloactinospora alba TaxID=405555 RepID=A0A543N7H2_9ACTN|nr:DUF397 domain-containing protein [Haloactinospora alba]TQN27760.1 uncharacterized protein DUF397 [Haloactinospora alba]